MRLREPQGEHEQDAGEEPRLRHPEQEAQPIEHGRAVGEPEQHRHQPPGEHDPREPDSRPDPLQEDVGGHLEQEIAQEEQGGAEAVGGLAEAERAHHLQLGVGDVLPVDIGHEVHEPEQRHQPQGHGTDRVPAEVRFRILDPARHGRLLRASPSPDRCGLITLSYRPGSVSRARASSRSQSTCASM